ncbi:MAG: beta-L-arabinofuranosidase domain-containing protein [Roseiarcus sp.]|uniref:glycoside hydrolase family 127 protein n=1 Tax=Roseiarcus sp. TaxID=1969460 RepID=UPI003C51EC82
MTKRSYSPVPFSEVAVTGPFWRERLDVVLARTIPSQHARLAEAHILEALKLPQPPPPLYIPRNSHNFTMQVFWDSDVGKWIEAASYALAHRRDPDIEAKVDAIVDDLDRAQRPDGYLNSWYNGREPDKRWTNLRDNHELYNAGHLLEGAIAYFRATGRRRLLDVMERYVDHIAATFGTAPGQKRGYCGHQEIELALVKLYRLTGDKRRLDLASYFIDERGRQPHYFTGEALARGDDPADYWAKTYEYNQSHIPVREQTRMVGHAVRGMYMASAMADLAFERDDEALKRACEALWRDVTTAQMYVTGGLGPSETNEGFTEPYDLPNESAYAETCAAVALAFWAQRMLHLDLDGAYADVMELALYNGALSGLSREGSHYFYANPLESRGQHKRWAWHLCPCCTMNVSRLVASIAGYAISASESGVAFHLYGGFETTAEIGGVKVALSERSDYPWHGGVEIRVEPETPIAFDLKLRIPGWAHSATVAVNGAPVELVVERGYANIRRRWSRGDIVTLNLPMPPERLYAHPRVRMDIGRVALRRGPLIYCVEEADNPGAAVQSLTLPRAASLEAEWRADVFDGAMTLVGEGRRLEPADARGALYPPSQPRLKADKVTAIPYHLWANREPGSMQVWIGETVE